MNDLPRLKYGSVVQQRDALEKKLADMAAENAELKKFGDTLFEMSKSLNGTGVGIQGNYEATCQQIGIDAAIDAFDEIETPATDAFTREMMARGVEAFAKDWKGAASYSQISEMANKFAANLRKGIIDAQ